MNRVEQYMQRVGEVPYNQLPNLRKVAKSLGLRQQTVYDLAEGSHLICMNVGFGTNGGIYEHEKIGDYELEWMGPAAPQEPG